MALKRDPFSRRNFLRGAGGVLLAAPYLPSLWPKAEAQATRDLRFVFVGGIYGMNYAKYHPAGDATEVTEGVHHRALRDIYGDDGFISPILGAEWDDLRDKVSIIRGLDGMEVAGDGHSATHALTGSGNVGSGPSFGESMDAVLEYSDVIYPQAPLVRALRTGPAATVDHNPNFSYSSRSGTLLSFSPEHSVRAVYERLFAPHTIARREARNGRQEPVVNAVMEDYRAALASRRISQLDRYKLEAHLSILSDVERSLRVSTPMCGDIAEPGEYTNASVAHEAMMDLEVAALACGMTKVVTHTISQHTDEMDVNGEEAHAAAHNGISDPAGSGRDAMEQWVMNRWSMRLVARFIKKLDAMPDPSGDEGASLLDNTAFLYGNVEARGYHTFYDLPVVVAGVPDKLRMGYHMDMRPRPVAYRSEYNEQEPVGRPYNNLLVTLMKTLGLTESDYERFGQQGFGVYDGYEARFADHYAPFVRARNATLPFLTR